MLTIDQVRTPEEIAAVGAILREYTSWVVTLEADSDGAPTFEGLKRELATLPGVYAPPSGRLLLDVRGRRAGGLHRPEVDLDDAGELKRLYVRPEARGHEVGRHLVERLVAEARVSGYRRLVLDSHISMTRAHDLYRGVGFRVVPAPDDFPDRFRPVVVFMEMDLA